MSPDRGRSTLERLIPALAPPEDASPVMSTFLRGLAIGALVGAAIAGSAMIGRRRSRDDRRAVGVEEPPRDQAQATTAIGEPRSVPLRDDGDPRLRT